MNAYREEMNKSEQVCNSTKGLCTILDGKYKKAYLNKVMKNQCQHITDTQRKELLKLLQKIEELFDKTIGNWKKYPVDFELKEDVKTICSRPHPVTKVKKRNIKIISLTFISNSSP